MKYNSLTKEELDEIKQKASDAMQQLERNEIDDPIIQYWHFSDWLLSIFNMLQTIENLQNANHGHCKDCHYKIEFCKCGGDCRNVSR